LSNRCGGDNLFQTGEPIQHPAGVVSWQRTTSLHPLGHSLPDASLLPEHKVSDGCDLRLFRRYCA
jgi:hypothetical protein